MQERSDLLLRAEFCWCATLGILGGPVFGRKSYAPEVRARRDKLHANLRFAASHGAEKCHVALLFLSGLVVFHVDYTAANHTRIEQNQRAMRVDGEGLGHFLKILGLGILAANADAYLHEHTLTPAADPAVCVSRCDLR